ncbi:deaminase [Nanoarchaeota archaeon]
MFPNLIEVTDEKHKYFLSHAYKAAMELSDDPLTKVGAIIVDGDINPNRMMLRGANNVSREVEGTQAELSTRLRDRTWKYENMIHAEHAVISWAKDLGLDIKGKIMYMPWIPCNDCAQHIINAELGSLVTHFDMVKQTPERWHDSTNEALQDLADHGIKCYTYTDQIEEFHSVFNGQVWFP